MSLTGLEQMAYLARQADVGQSQGVEKQAKRTQKMKKEELERQEHLQKSQVVASTSSSDKIEALGHEQHREKQEGWRKSDEEAQAKHKSRQYYNDPSVGGHIDISS